MWITQHLAARRAIAHIAILHYVRGKNMCAPRSLLASVLAAVIAAARSGTKTDGDQPAAAGSPAPVAAKTSEAKPTASGREYQIAWSVWTGYMPFNLMEAKGFLARRAADKGLKVKLVEFPVYMDSVTAFAAGKLDGCALTAMEALQPAAAGIDTRVAL